MLRPTIDTLAPAEDPAVDSYARDPGVLWVRIAPGPARRFELWDGTSIARDDTGAIKVESGSTFSRGFVLELIATPEPAEVQRDGVVVTKNQGWTWEAAASGTLRIELSGSGVVRVR
jgi:alpha-D-xyloside xylohydrolase